jgi:signal transduction histidine kinase
MKRELVHGCQREAQAQAAILAAKTRCGMIKPHRALSARVSRLLFALRSSKEKDNFVAMVSHEARTRLGSLLGLPAF